MLFDLEFNSFIEERTLVDGVIPCISIYDQLTVASDVFIDLVFAAAMSIRSGRVVPTELERCREIGSRPSFQEEFRQCMHMVLGKCDRANLRYDNLLRSSPDTSFLFMVMSAGASRFAWYHEYGHLLMGHLAVGACPEVEFEADHFAWLLVNHQFGKTSSVAAWSCLGALALILVAGFLESASGVSQTRTHPPATSRIEALLATLNERDRNGLQEYLNAAVAICSPALSRFWSARID